MTGSSAALDFFLTETVGAAEGVEIGTAEEAEIVIVEVVGVGGTAEEVEAGIGVTTGVINAVVGSAEEVEAGIIGEDAVGVVTGAEDGGGVARAVDAV